jgi:hypothetical protein
MVRNVEGARQANDRNTLQHERPHESRVAMGTREKHTAARKTTARGTVRKGIKTNKTSTATDFPFGTYGLYATILGFVLFCAACLYWIVITLV